MQSAILTSFTSKINHSLQVGKQSLQCPQLSHAQMSGLWIPFCSKRLETLEVNMLPENSHQPTLDVLASSLLLPHASTLKHLSLVHSFFTLPSWRSDTCPPPSHAFEQLLSFELSATVHEATQFFRTYAIPTNIESFRLTVLGAADFDDAADDMHVRNILHGLGMSSFCHDIRELLH